VYVLGVFILRVVDDMRREVKDQWTVVNIYSEIGNEAWTHKEKALSSGKVYRRKLISIVKLRDARE